MIAIPLRIISFSLWLLKHFFFVLIFISFTMICKRKIMHLFCLSPKQDKSIYVSLNNPTSNFSILSLTPLRNECKIFQSFLNFLSFLFFMILILSGYFLRSSNSLNLYAVLILLSCCCSVARLCLTLWDPTDCSMLGFPVLHFSQSLLKFMSIEYILTCNHLILSPPSPPAALLLNPSYWIPGLGR